MKSMIGEALTWRGSVVQTKYDSRVAFAVVVE